MGRAKDVGSPQKLQSVRLADGGVEAFAVQAADELWTATGL
jgi:hypothetical protein